jgi:hypothetical protein
VFSNIEKTVYPSPPLANLDWIQGSKTTGSLRHITSSPLWQTEKPFCLTLPLPKGQPKSNLIADNYDDIQFCNARGREQEFSLDTHGFAFATLPPLSVDIDDTRAVDTEYVRQMEAFLNVG